MKAYSGIEKCDCPLGVKYYVSTPLGPETLNNDLQVNPVMLGTVGGDDKNKAKDDNNKDANKDNSKDNDDNKKKPKDTDNDNSKDDKNGKNKDDQNKNGDDHHKVESKPKEHPKVQSN